MTRAIWSSRLRVSNFRNTEQPRVVIARLHVQEISRSSQRRTAYMDSSIFVLCITRYNHGSEFVILQDRSRHLQALSGSWSYLLITSWPCSSKTHIKKWLRLVTTQWLADIGKSTSAFFVEKIVLLSLEAVCERNSCTSITEILNLKVDGTTERDLYGYILRKRKKISY